MTGRFPFTLPPLPDEPFGLWWHTYAARLGVTTTELALAAGLPAGRPPGRAHAPTIAAATGLTTDQVTATFTTTRSCPPAAVLRVWTPQPASRFCPHCLTEQATRPTGWSAAWQLPLAFYCLSHDQPLATSCPACHQPPPSAGPHSPAWAGTWSCPSCGHNLADAARRRPPAGRTRSATAAAQRRITDALHRLRDPHGTPASRQQAQHELTDITLIAAHLTTDLVGHRTGRLAGLPDAAAFTDAIGQLNPPRTGADPLAGLVARCYPGPRIPAVPSSWRPASPTLTERIVHSRQSDLRPLDRLRHATTLPAPVTTLDRPAADPAPRRAAQLPDQLWPVWAIRLTDDDSIDGPFFRSAMTAAMLLPHSDLPLGRLTALLPHQPGLEAVGHQLRRLATLPNTDAVLRILTELALSLDRHGVPIDYARRHRLAAQTTLLDRPTWRALCAGSGLHVGRRRRLDLARGYLYELLTGGSLTTAPPPYQLTDATLRIDHIEFAAAMPAPLAAALSAHAEGLLATAGITGEPLTWHPPTDWTTVTTWPGADPEITDPAPIHQAVQQRWASTPHNHWAPTHAVAASLGISSQHLREVLRRHPIPRAPYRPNRRSLIAAPANGGPPHRAEHHPDHPRRIFHVDPDWLREQRTTWGRTLEDIAAEIGCTRATLRNFAAEQHIPPSSRNSTASIHTGAAPGHPADLPDLLRAALRGPAARGRLERFLLITDQPHPSLTAAAASIGAQHSRLTVQLHRLEHACGGHLLQRRPKPQPLGPPTALGEQLRRQALKHLDRTTP